MKLKFQSNLQYQNDAIDSIVQIFNGQKSRQSNFTVLNNHNLNQEQISFETLQTRKCAKDSDEKQFKKK